MRNFSLKKFAVVAVVYAAFTGWLMYPWLDHFSGSEYLFLLTCPVAAMGAYLLTRRWVYSSLASLLAGVIYGFGSFSLGLLCYHPMVSVVYCLVPISILPAAFADRLTSSANKIRLISVLGSLLPFLFILASFEIAAKMFYYPMPLNTPAVPQVFLAFISPIPFSEDLLCPAFFHIPIVFLFIGLVMLFKIKRITPIAIFLAAIAACFFPPILNVPPVFWLSIVVLVLAVTIATGIQAMTLAGRTDSLWILIAACISIIAAAIAFVLTKEYDARFIYAAQLYSIGALAAMIVFFITRTKSALHAIRLVIMFAGLSVDILITTPLLMRSVF